MKNIILLGNEGRRKDFFLKAAEDLSVKVYFCSLYSEEVFKIQDIENYCIKIDPPTYKTSDYSFLNLEISKYTKYLDKLKKKKFTFLNTPTSILSTLDKHEMKYILEEKNIETTKKIILKEYKRECLFEKLRDENLSNIFIKPRYGSGAVGILALKYNHKLNDYVLFTSLIKKENNYYNTKKLRRIRDKQLILDFIDRILIDRPIVEKWVEKKRYNNKSFDIRVLVQFGKVLFMVARMSDGPITNLHLNNQGIDVNLLGIEDEILENIKKISIEAVKSFNGLNCGGVDILLSKSNDIFVIEVNGQGDLIYKDIYKDNIIYKDQIGRMIRIE